MTPKVKRDNDINELMTQCSVFWAFSNSQFEEGKAKIGLQQGEKLVDIGAGGFMPLKNKDMYINSMKRIYEEFKNAMQDPEARIAHIKYELDNHEAYYTRNVESTLEALGDEFTRKEVLAVFDGRNKKNK